MARFQIYGRATTGSTLSPTSQYVLQRSSGPYQIPDRVYMVGDIVSVTAPGFSAPVSVTYVGYFEEGTHDILIFQRTGLAEFVLLTNNPLSGSLYTPQGDIITDTPYNLSVATFADIGQRDAGDTGDVFNSLDFNVEFDQDTYTVGSDVTLRLFRLSNGARTQESEVNSTFLGFDRRTGDPVFRLSNGNHVVLTNAKQAMYTVRVDDLVVTESWPAPDTSGVTFSNYGFRRDLDAAFDLQGRGPVAGLEIPDGLYRVGDIVTIRPFGGEGGGGPVTVRFVGQVARGDGGFYPVFHAYGGGGAQFIGTNEPDGTATYEPGAFILDEPLAVGAATFADYGLRVGETDVFNSQNDEVEFDQGVYEVGDDVVLRIYQVSGGEPTSVVARFAGFDRETGNPIFNPRSGGRQIVLTNTEQATYTIPEDDIVLDVWPLDPPGATFSNYGFRQGGTGDFDLQGIGDISGLVVPPGVYKPGDKLTIRPRGGEAGGRFREVEYLGFYNQGQFQYPVFEATDFKGVRTQFIGTGEPGSEATYAPPGNLVIQPLGIGVAKFADYGLRVPEGEGETSNLNSQDREIEFDYQFLTVGESVTLRIFRMSGNERTLQETVQATFAGFDRKTGDPIFSHPEQNGQPWRGGRQIIAASVHAGTYVVPHGDDVDDGDGTVEDRTGGDIIAESWPPPAIDATFTNYGIRQGANLENDAFDLQGTGVTFGLHVPPGIYTEGNTYQIELHGGTADGPLTVTFVGYVTGADGTEYPIFEHADFKGNGRAQFIGTNEPRATDTYTVTSGDITDDEPLGIGDATFGAWAINGTPGDDDNIFEQIIGEDSSVYTDEIGFAYDVYEPGDRITTSVSTQRVTYVGYEEGSGFPVFRIFITSFRIGQFIMLDAPPGVDDYVAGNIVTKAWPPETLVSTFSNYGFRQGDGDLADIDFDLLGAGIDVPDGLYRKGDTVTIRFFGGESDNPGGGRGLAGLNLETTYIGHIVGPDGRAYPVFEAANFRGGGKAQFIGTDHPRGTTTTYDAGEIDGDAPYRVGDAASDGHTAFANYGFRRGDNLEDSDFDLQGTGRNSGIEIPHGAYRVGDTLVIQPFGGEAAGGSVTVTFVGHVDGPGGVEYPVFEAADFRGSGERAQFIATGEAGTGTYDPGEIDEDEPYATGVVTFADYALRALPGQGDTAFLYPQDREIEFDYDFLTLNEEVTLRIYRVIGGERTLENTIEARFAGYDPATHDPLFDPVDGSAQILAVSLDVTDSYRVPSTAIVAEDWPPAAPADATFSNYGFLKGVAGDFDLQGTGPSFGLDMPDGVYMAGDRLTIRAFGSPASRGTFTVTYRGHIVGPDGEVQPVFQALFSRAGGTARFIGTDQTGTGTASYSYDLEALITDMPFRVGNGASDGHTAFTNYGFRRGDNLEDSDFDLQGTGHISWIEIPHGAYRVGDTLVIQPFGGEAAGGSVTVTFVGHVDGPGGVEYPVFEAANFRGSGQRAQFIATDETGTGSYDPGEIDEDKPYATGVARFADYGLRIPEGEGETDNLNSQDREIEFDYQFLTVGTSVNLRIFRVGATEPEVTLQAQFAGFDRETGDPIFSHPEQGGQTWRGGRQIIASSVKIPGGAYVVPHGDDGDDGDGTVEDRTGGDIIAESWPPPAIDATYTNYGFRQGANLENDAFDLQGSGVIFGIHVPPGVYREGNTYQIELHGGDANGAVTVTFVGYVTTADGTEYPIFEHADFRGNGRAQFIGTNEPHATETYAVASGDITDDEPLGIGVATFADYGLRNGTSDVFNSQDREIEFDYDELTLNENVTLRIYRVSNDGTRTLENTIEARFAGYDPATDNPLFSNPMRGGQLWNSGRQIIAASVRQMTYTVPSADIVAESWPPRTDEPDPPDPPPPLEDAQFDAFFFNFNNVAGGNRYVRDFSGMVVEGDDAVISATDDDGNAQYTAGSSTTDIRIPFAGVETGTFIGYEAGTFFPIFQVSALGGTIRVIALNGVGLLAGNGPDIYNVDPADIVTDMPYTVCFAPGTLIATPDGERPVETLKPGDVVLTAHDGVATVKWVGFQKVPTMFGPPELTCPVRIMAGALDDNVPHTDLVVTKDHGMIVDGVICHAGALINGTSIVEVPTRELARDQHGLATYYHVETLNHVPLLANGAAAESFIDNVDRSVFGNHSEFVALYGAVVPAMTEMNLPRAMSTRQLPRRISSRLATRAAMLLPSAVRGPVTGSA